MSIDSVKTMRNVLKEGQFDEAWAKPEAYGTFACMVYER